MGWVVALFTGVAVIIMSVGSLVLLWRMWSIRHEFEIAARSPQLVVLIGFTCYIMCMTVLLQWFLLSVGTSFPCWVVYWNNYLSEIPTCGRGYGCGTAVGLFLHGAF